jgi:hypothetical protein
MNGGSPQTQKHRQWPVEFELLRIREPDPCSINSDDKSANLPDEPLP